MATTNVSYTRSGTGFTMDVTACNLDPSVAVRDFVIFNNGSFVPNTNYTKTSQTILTYVGASLPSTSIEVRRKTPAAVISPVVYASKMSSSLWNSELDRKTRWQEEADLNGVGASSLVTVATPQDNAFDATWDGNTVFPPTKNAVYDYVSTLATKASPALTGTPTAPTAAATTNTTQIATTAFVQGEIATKANLASPTFSGTPTAPTQALSDSSTKLATTNWVYTWMFSEKPYALHTYSTSRASGVGANLISTDWTRTIFRGGMSVSGADWMRVSVDNLWWRITGSVENSSALQFTSLNVIISKFNGSGFDLVKSVLNKSTSSGHFSNPVYTFTTDVFLPFGGNDRVVNLYIFQSNIGAAAATMTGQLTAERLHG